MKTRTSCNCSGMGQRGAFTLVELMVVITIMVALAAITASAVLKFIGVQQTSNTQSTLDRVQSQLARAWSKVKDDAIRSPMTEPAYIPGTIPPQPAGVTVGSWIATNLASNANNAADPNVKERTRIIYVKLRLRQAFPMNFNEALYPAPLPQLSGYVTYLTNLGIAGSSAGSASIESSACLLMALQRGVSGAGIDPADLTSGGAAGSFPTPLPLPAGSLPYLNDAWSRPIFFTRVPAGSPLLNANPYPNGGQSGANDPGDPQGYLQAGGWALYPNGTPTPQAQLFVKLTQQPLAAVSCSYKLAPLVASGGPSDWTNRGTIPTPASSFDPITFAPVAGGDALFSTP